MEPEAQALADALRDPHVLMHECDMLCSRLSRRDFIFESLVKAGWPVYRDTILGNIGVRRGRLDVTTTSKGLIYTWLL